MIKLSKFFGASLLVLGFSGLAYLDPADSMDMNEADEMTMDGQDSMIMKDSMNGYAMGKKAKMEIQGINRASFTEDNQVKQPIGWRQWVFIGSPLTPNALNGGEAAFPEFHNVYIEPSAFEAYSRTGEFPEGTQIVKELLRVQFNDTSDPNGATLEASGRGYFQGKFNGLEILVKDNQRFPSEPGGWAFFSFAHNTSDYAATASVLPAESCSFCHQANAEQDFVFTQFYPVLTAARPENGDME